ncbi:MAG: UDP-N-acetylmuramoyl-tripeptide--D-alanyl-D-alanine ligase [Candidatus Paracaedibacter sp.]
MTASKPYLWTGQEVAAALSMPELPVASGAVEWGATGISIDSRTLEPGDLYIAIRGDTHDGHAFVADAFAKGAVAAIVDHPIELPDQSPQIIVGTTLEALSKLGAFARQRTKATIIAITGSVGKTSTKELLRHVLEGYGVTFASPASYNNHWGLPLSLACLPRDAIYGVFELGMNHRGEIAPLASLACPHIAVITAIAEAHIGLMASRQDIAEEKSDIFNGSPPPGLAIINQDAPEFELMRSHALKCGISKILGFGKTEKAAIRLIDYTTDSTGQKGIVTASLNGQKVVYTLPQPGEHVALNSLIALAIGEVLGLDQGQLIAQLKTILAVKGRGNQHRIPVAGGEILLIDDAYNANLTSMQAGLSVLAGIPVSPQGRRVVVLGEMLELGDQAEVHHQQLIMEVLARPIHRIFAVGGTVMETAFSNNVPADKAGGYATSVDALIPLVLNTLRPGDIIFVKGSKGSRVSKVVDSLLGQNNVQDGVI